MGEGERGAGQSGGEVREGAAFVLQPVLDLFSRQGGEQEIGAERRVGGSGGME